MHNIIDVIQQQPYFFASGQVTESDIAKAEQTLGVRFANDYRNYVAAFGIASYSGHELTGICKCKRLEVVAVTLEERQNTPVPTDWYVLEQAHIDGIVIWQATNGAIFQTTPNGMQKKICDSLIEYIQL